MVAPNYISRQNLTKLLLVQENTTLLKQIQPVLAGEGRDVAGAVNGVEVLKKIPRLLPGLIVLDLALPLRDGFEICRQIRSDAAFCQLPILVMAANAGEAEAALELGADDHVIKPFATAELLLRMRRLLQARRPAGVELEEDEIDLEDLHLDFSRHEATVQGEPIHLTQTEFKLLKVLARRRGRVQTRERLLRDVWEYNSWLDTRTVDTHVQRLRRKLGAACRFVESIRGFGYRMVDIGAASAPAIPGHIE